VALELAQQHPGQIELIATDVIMPEMNGRELPVRLRQRPPGLACVSELPE
jgi:CheY-like chemotaxis protein